MIDLTTADIANSPVAQAILDAIPKRWPWVKHLFADGAAYCANLAMLKIAQHSIPT